MTRVARMFTRQRNVMNPTWFNTILGTSLLLAIAYTGTCQETAGCAEGYYLHEDECDQCPDYCVSCISDTNCTKCNNNNYGPVCQHACQEECTDKCHKKYGYCTYGCVDGQYPVEDESYCSNCPSNCTICNTLANCIVCHSGYHGNTCQYQCPRHCDKCVQQTGDCLVCAKGYFNKDGRCHTCPDGCLGCYNERKCSGCKDGYTRLHDGQCIMECPKEKDGLNITSISLDKSGLSNEIADTSDCFDPGGSHKISFKTSTPCISSMPCPEGHHCSTEDSGTATCAAIMTHDCIHMCHSFNLSYYDCKPDCTEIRNTYSLFFCLSNSSSVSFGSVSTIWKCLPASDDTDKAMKDSFPITIILLVSILSTMCLTIPMSILLYRGVKRKCALCKSKRDDSDTETGINRPSNGEDDGPKKEQLHEQDTGKKHEEISLLPIREAMHRPNDTFINADKYEAIDTSALREDVKVTERTVHISSDLRLPVGNTLHDGTAPPSGIGHIGVNDSRLMYPDSTLHDGAASSNMPASGNARVNISLSSYREGDKLHDSVAPYRLSGSETRRTDRHSPQDADYDRWFKRN